MVTHVASARSDAKSKKKKKAIDIFFCVKRWGIVFVEFRVPPSSKLGFGGGGFELGVPCFFGGSKDRHFYPKILPER